jgi:hypothetical protein
VTQYTNGWGGANLKSKYFTPHLFRIIGAQSTARLISVGSLYMRKRVRDR